VQPCLQKRATSPQKPKPPPSIQTQRPQPQQPKIKLTETKEETKTEQSISPVKVPLDMSPLKQTRKVTQPVMTNKRKPLVQT
jgi:hypothetical protein